MSEKLSLKIVDSIITIPRIRIKIARIILVTSIVLKRYHPAPNPKRKIPNPIRDDRLVKPSYIVLTNLLNPFLRASVKDDGEAVISMSLDLYHDGSRCKAVLMQAR